MKPLSIVLLLIILFSKCSVKETQTDVSKGLQYLHISHLRTDSYSAMDSTAEQIDYSKYNMLWLGGDLHKLTSKNESIIVRVDSILDLGNTSTLWSLGNHDYTHLSLVAKFTKRPPFYACSKNGITFLILDTQDSLTNIVGKQRRLVHQVLDTIRRSTHLVVLHHKLLWMDDHPKLSQMTDSVSNGELGERFYCLNKNNFNRDIYPNLVSVRKKGIKVICIGGDIGLRVNEFEYTTTDDIQFLASGISSGKKENKALLFVHDTVQNSLTWSFKLLDNL